MAERDDAAKAQPPLSTMAMPVARAARLIGAAGGHVVTPEQIRADIDAGAPANPDGTINVIHYAAWLVSEVCKRGD